MLRPELLDEQSYIKFEGKLSILLLSKWFTEMVKFGSLFWIYLCVRWLFPYEIIGVYGNCFYIKWTSGRFLFSKHLEMLLEYLRKKNGCYYSYLYQENSQTIKSFSSRNIALIMFQSFLALFRCSHGKLQLHNLGISTLIHIIVYYSVYFFSLMTLLGFLAFLSNSYLTFIWTVFSKPVLYAMGKKVFNTFAYYSSMLVKCLT